jgi:hypothetical protein
MSLGPYVERLPVGGAVRRAGGEPVQARISHDDRHRKDRETVPLEHSSYGNRSSRCPPTSAALAG